MKITNEHIGRLLEARLERIQRASQPSHRAPAGRAQLDRATFSPRAEDMRIALAAVRSAADPEEPRLASLARQIRSGRYRVSAEAVADSLLRDLRGS
jgi:anti-sigma28 factor (negative regulator of flagellin synthesis)